LGLTETSSFALISPNNPAIFYDVLVVAGDGLVLTKPGTFTGGLLTAVDPVPAAAGVFFFLE